MTSTPEASELSVRLLEIVPELRSPEKIGSIRADEDSLRRCLEAAAGLE